MSLQKERGFYLAMICACDRLGILPDDETLHWVIHGIAKAVRLGRPIEEGLGIKIRGSGSRSQILDSRLTMRNALYLNAAALLEGSNREKAKVIHRRLLTLRTGKKPADKADRILLLSIDYTDREIGVESIRQALKRSPVSTEAGTEAAPDVDDHVLEGLSAVFAADGVSATLGNHRCIPANHMPR